MTLVTVLLFIALLVSALAEQRMGPTSNCGFRSTARKLAPMYEIFILGPRDKIPEKSVMINTTSRSKDFGKIFSPMICQGPLDLGGLSAQNVENFWQGTKVYKEHLDNPQEWIRWRNNLLKDKLAHRYPMGKGARPEFSYLNSELGRMNYIQARKNIYIPLYKQKLSRYCSKSINSVIDMLTVTNISLWDFDGRITSDSFDDIVNNSEAKCGHAFVLKKYIYDLLDKRF